MIVCRRDKEALIGSGGEVIKKRGIPFGVPLG